MASEKTLEGLPLTTPPHAPIPTKSLAARLRPVAGLLALAGLVHLCAQPISGRWSASPNVGELDSLLLKGSCPAQVDPLDIGGNWDAVNDESYASLATKRLSQAIQINTVSFDDMGDVDDDPRYEGVAKFNAFLDNEFASLKGKVELEMLNRFARLYTWKGSNPDLKSVVLMAHMDTVPVPDYTVDRWTYAPWSGHVDSDGWIWGRGAADCKNTLLATLGAVEKLVQEGFEPERNIILAFGFDEEIGGLRGAGVLAKTIEERYGKNSVQLIVDEGFTGVDEAYGVQIASLGVAEKGSVNVQIEVDTLGGHSSVPPAHTSIGILSLLLATLEANPFPAKFKPTNPYLQMLQCAADFGPDMDDSLKSRLKDPRKWDDLADELSQDRIVRAFLGTTIAIDIVSGGVKVNALPETAKATVNHRIDFTSSVNETLEYVLDVLEPVVRKLNLTLSHPGHESVQAVDVVRLDFGKRFVDSPGFGLEPAPLTPTHGKAFELVAGTIRKVFADAIVAPSGMIANTDTKTYWNLTENIFRFLPAPLAEVKNFHTVDERISIKGHLTVASWYYKLLANTAGWDAE